MSDISLPSSSTMYNNNIKVFQLVINVGSDFKVPFRVLGKRKKSLVIVKREESVFIKDVGKKKCFRVICLYSFLL